MAHGPNTVKVDGAKRKRKRRYTQKKRRKHKQGVLKKQEADAAGRNTKDKSCTPERTPRGDSPHPSKGGRKNTDQRVQTREGGTAPVLYDSGMPVAGTSSQLPAPPAAAAQRSRTPARALPWMRGKSGATQKGSGKEQGRRIGMAQQGKAGKKK